MACRCSCRGWGARSGRARPWSRVSTARTSPRRRRCGCSPTGARSHSPGGALRPSTEPASWSGEVDADRDQLAGVTYHDPDGELAYCYNSETASMRLHVYERARRGGRLGAPATLIAPGRAHFEYAQRDPGSGPRAADPVKLPEPFYAHGDHIAIELAGPVPCSRRGGVASPRARTRASTSGRWTDDDPEAVEPTATRGAVAGVRLAYGRQVHGSTVTRVSNVRRESAAPESRPTARRRRSAVCADGPDRRLPADRRGRWRRGGDAPRGLARSRRRGDRGGRAAPSGSWPAPGRSPRRSAPAQGRAATRSAMRSMRSFADHGAEARSGRNLDLKAIAGARARARRRGRDPRRRAVHDLLGPFAVLLASARSRRDGPPGGRRMVELIRGLDAGGGAAPTSSGSARRSPLPGRPGGGGDSRCGQVRARWRSSEPGRAGVALVGENRAQDLVAKAEAYPGRFTWDFIGELQSRKVQQLLPYVRYIHSVASDSVLAQLERHGDDDDRGPGGGQRRRRGGQGGIAPDELGAFLERCPVTVVGLMTMPPLAATREDSRPFFARAAASWPSATSCASSRWEPARTTWLPSRRARRSCVSARACTSEAVRRPPARHNHGRETAPSSEPSPPAWPFVTPGIARSSTSAWPKTRPTRTRSSRTPSPRSRSRTPTASGRTYGG